jgi:hypothetical protein
MDKNLETLNKIESFGKPVYNGQHFSYKQRRKVTPDVTAKLNILKTRYPELIVYHTQTTGAVIFGGTFSTHSNFMFEMKFIMKAKLRAPR